MGSSRIKQNLGWKGIHKECTFHHCSTSAVITRHYGINPALSWLLLNSLCRGGLCKLHLLKSVHLSFCSLCRSWRLLPLLLPLL
jgi:thiosulfate reductase cytochrome b subunit